MMVSGFATATLYGTVSSPAEERFFGVREPRRFFELSVTVEGAKGKRMVFPLAVFDEGLMVQVQQLCLNQRVLVTCALSSNPWQGKDGRLRSAMSLTARSIVAGQAHASRSAAAVPAVGGLKPPASMDAVPAGAAAAVGLADEDIPF